MCPHYMLFLDDTHAPIVTCRFVSVVFVVALIEIHPHLQLDYLHPYMYWEAIFDLCTTDAPSRLLANPQGETLYWSRSEAEASLSATYLL